MALTGRLERRLQLCRGAVLGELVRRACRRGPPPGASRSGVPGASPAASRSSPVIARRTWRSSSNHRRACSAAVGAPGCSTSAPASATASGRGRRGPRSSSERRVESAIRSGQRVSAPNAGSQRPVALAGREFEPVEQLRRPPLLVPRRRRGRFRARAGRAAAARAVRPRAAARSPAACEGRIEGRGQVQRAQHAERPRATAARQAGPALPARVAARRPRRPPETLSSALAAERLRGELGGVGLDLEVQARAVAGQPQQAGGVVDEAALVEHPQQPSPRGRRGRGRPPPARPRGSPTAGPRGR